jgi:hypothetical protein
MKSELTREELLTYATAAKEHWEQTRDKRRQAILETIEKDPLKIKQGSWPFHSWRYLSVAEAKDRFDGVVDEYFEYPSREWSLQDKYRNVNVKVIERCEQLIARASKAVPKKYLLDEDEMDTISIAIPDA